MNDKVLKCISAWMEVMRGWCDCHPQPLVLKIGIALVVCRSSGDGGLPEDPAKAVVAQNHHALDCHHPCSCGSRWVAPCALQSLALLVLHSSDITQYVLLS